MSHEKDDVVPLWIDNAPVPTEDSRTYPVIQARTGQTVHHYHSASSAQATRAVESAGRAFESWKTAVVSEKRQLLNKVADLMEHDISYYVDLECEETSALEAWAEEDVKATTAILREAAAMTSAIRGCIPQIDKADATGFIFKVPVGVVAIIPPWNAPYVLAARALATAVAAGCTVVLKGSETCPATHLALAKAFSQAGAQPGQVNMVLASRNDGADCTEALFSNRHVRKIDFIGSAAVGAILGAQASKYLKPITLELGGKCPAIVLDDADLSQAATLCADGALRAHGQVCFSTERIIVHEKVADKFIFLLKAEVEGFGDIGTAVTQSVAAHAREILVDAKEQGCEFLCGGTEYVDGETKAILQPTVVLQPNQKARIVDEETFGPSMSVYIVPDDEKAVEIANSSAYGLNATIHSKNLGRALAIAKQLEYGQVHINTSTLFVGPFATQGGVKSSGWGRQNSSWGIDEVLEEKFVSWRTPGSTTSGDFH